jgi:adenosylcobinamide kinase / adenosylcobinamide-phosphate guanylyltransferase
MTAPHASRGRLPPMAVTLVIGGTRSGKSRHAEGLVVGSSDVTYLATGPLDEGSDEEWSRRLALHRERRPSGWSVVETLDVAGVLAAARGTVVVDCLGTWVTGLVDAAGLWDDLDAATALLETATDVLRDALTTTRAHVVVVTNEVGLAPVATTPSGRWFQEALGRLNAVVASWADRVHLVVAGRVLDLSDAPVVP